MEGEKTGGREGLRRKGNKSGEINRGKVKNEKNGEKGENAMEVEGKSAHREC